MNQIKIEKNLYNYKRSESNQNKKALTFRDFYQASEFLSDGGDSNS